MCDYELNKEKTAGVRKNQEENMKICQKQNIKTKQALQRCQRNHDRSHIYCNHKDAQAETDVLIKPTEVINESNHDLINRNLITTIIIPW